MTNSTSKTKTQAQAQIQPQPFSAEQRKGMARLLADAKKRVQDGLESDYDLNERIEAEILPKLAEERKASSLIEKVRRSRKENKEAEEALGKLGFAMSDYDNSVSLSEKAPKELSEALEKARRAQRARCRAPQVRQGDSQGLGGGRRRRGQGDRRGASLTGRCN